MNDVLKFPCGFCPVMLSEAALLEHIASEHHAVIFRWETPHP
jgi:hypothetical protein